MTAPSKVSGAPRTAVRARDLLRARRFPVNDEFRHAPERMLSDDQFHPSAAGYALAASQLLPALCQALGHWSGEPALSSAGATEAGPGNLALRLLSRLWRRPTTGVPAPIVVSAPG